MIISSNEANINDQASLINLFPDQMLRLTIEQLFDMTQIEDNFMIIKKTSEIIFMVQQRDL